MNEDANASLVALPAAQHPDTLTGQSRSATLGDDRGRSRRALVALLLAVLAFSAHPLIVLWGEGADQPLGLAAAWSTGVSLFSFLWLASWGRRSFAAAGGWRAVGGSFRHPRQRWLWLVLFAARLDVFFLGMASRASSLAIVAVIYNAYSLLTVLALGVWFRHQSRYRSVTAHTWRIMFLAWGFLALVIASEHGTLLPAGESGAGAWYLAIALAFVSAVLATLHTASLKLGTVLARPGPVPRRRGEFAMIVAVNAVANALVALGTWTAVWISGEATQWSALGIVVVATGLCTGAGAMAWRYALLETRHPEIGVLTALIPAIVLLWMFLAAVVDVREPTWLAVGLTGLVATNVLIQRNIRRSHHVDAQGAPRDLMD